MTQGQAWPVSMTVRFHLFPFRTQKLSSLVPKIVGWKRPVKIGRCRLLLYGPLVKRLRQRPLTPLTWVRFPHGSPKNAPQLRLGSFFGASVRGIEQDGRPQAAKKNPADCFLVRGRWTHGSPRSTTSFEVVLFSLYLLFKGKWEMAVSFGEVRAPRPTHGFLSGAVGRPAPWPPWPFAAAGSAREG